MKDYKVVVTCDITIGNVRASNKIEAREKANKTLAKFQNGLKPLGAKVVEK